MQAGAEKTWAKLGAVLSVHIGRESEVARTYRSNGAGVTRGGGSDQMPSRALRASVSAAAWRLASLGICSYEVALVRLRLGASIESAET